MCPFGNIEKKFELIILLGYITIMFQSTNLFLILEFVLSKKYFLNVNFMYRNLCVRLVFQPTRLYMKKSHFQHNFQFYYTVYRTFITSHLATALVYLHCFNLPNFLCGHLLKFFAFLFCYTAYKTLRSVHRTMA